MKYKKQIATGALAISLLVGGSNVFAATPQDLGIKNVQQVYQKQNKNLKTKNQGKTNTIVIVSVVTSIGFTMEVKSMKTKVTSSVDVATDTSTMYSKNGVKTTSADLTVGQKVIVTGNLDTNTNILTAKTVKIVSNSKPKN